ncbi:KikA [Pseudomonas sp. RT6P73]
MKITGTLYRTEKRFAPGKYIKSLILGTVVFGASSAFAHQDPCITNLCMWKLLSGTDTTGCDSAITDHFNILVYRKKGVMDWNATARKRLTFTNSCSTADRGKTQEVNDKFGKVRRR